MKTAIFSGTNARLYNYKAPATWKKMDRFSALKQDYRNSGPSRTNLRYGYIALANHPFPRIGLIRYFLRRAWRKIAFNKKACRFSF